MEKSGALLGGVGKPSLVPLCRQPRVIPSAKDSCGGLMSTNLYLAFMIPVF